MQVDLDSEFLNIFFGLTESSVPENVDIDALKKQLDSLVNLVNQLDKNSRKSVKAILNPEVEKEESTAPAMLIVDDLGVITYQLRVLLQKFKYEIDVSHEIYDAVNKYRKRNYEFVIMDLFIPTDREGFMLLSELRKIADNTGRRPTIGVMTASNKKELEGICRSSGADFFLEKNADWQHRLYGIINEFVNGSQEV